MGAGQMVQGLRVCTVSSENPSLITRNNAQVYKSSSRAQPLCID